LLDAPQRGFVSELGFKLRADGDVDGNGDDNDEYRITLGPTERVVSADRNAEKIVRKEDCF